jgi:hypothetical protein
VSSDYPLSSGVRLFQGLLCGKQEVLVNASRWILLAVVLGFLPGCSRGPTKTDLAPEEKHILKLAALYSEFRGKNGRGPNNLEELKTFARGLSKEDLASRNIDDLDKAFISPRDNQPYKVVGAQAARRPAQGGPPMPMVVIYEATGVNGKRMVASGMGGGAFEMDEEKLKEHVLNP